MTSHLDVVFLDVGGPIYGDRPYYDALWRAIAEARPEASESRFWEEFEACRHDQKGPFTRRLVRAFLPESELPRVIDRGRQLWSYPPEALHSDVLPALEALHDTYRLGLLANQEEWIRETLSRDGLDRFFSIWIVSGELGVEKPDPAIFHAAVRAAQVAADRCAMVGDRLDNDIIPARAVGMRTVWLLRGEAPEQPTPQQLDHADRSVRSLTELSAALQRL
jgi:putative hydrolase of the HAD superfamily